MRWWVIDYGFFLSRSRSDILRVDWEDLTGQYLLEFVLLYTARGAVNIGGRSGVVYVEHCVTLWLNRYSLVRLRQRCAGVGVR